MRYQRTFGSARVGDLQVDPAYQPEPNRAWGKTLADGWEEPADPIHVAVRKDGSLWTTDGQHRSMAKRILEGEDAQIEAFFYTGLNVRDEALLFLRLNRQKQKNALKKWQARLTAGDHDPLAIEGILAELGIKRSRGGHQDGLKAVDACEDVYGAGGPAGLRQVLQLQRDAWSMPYPKIAYRAVIMKGLSRFLREYRVDLDRLLASLRRTSPDQLQSLANGGMEGALHTDAPAALVRALEMVYNRDAKQAGGRPAARVS